MSTYDLGTTVRIGPETFTDLTGALTDPTTVTLTVTDPVGTATTPTVVKDSTGTYHADFTTTIAGRHTFRWLGTGTISVAAVGEFDVRSSVATGLVSLEDVKAHLNIPSGTTTSDTELVGFINAATTPVQDIAGPILPRKLTSEVHSGGAVRIALRHGPIASIQSVTEWIGNTAFTLTSQPQGSTVDYYGYELIDSNAGILVRRDATGGLIPFQSGPLGTQVSYTAGYTVLPEAVRLGTLELIRHWWQRSQQGGRPNFRGSGMSDDGMTTVGAYLVPNFVEEILASTPSSPRRVPGIA